MFLSILAAGCGPSAAPVRAPPAADSLRFDETSAVTVPTDVPTVQDGVDAVADGETVCLEPGTFGGPVSVSIRTVRIAGHGAGTSVIDGEGLGSAVAVYASTLELAGVTIRGGAAAFGGGINSSISTVAFDADVVVADNDASVSGGGIYASQSTLAFDGTRVRANHAGDTGGGLYVELSVVDAAGLVVKTNVADGAGAGGLFVARSGITLANSGVFANDANGPDAEGGGLYLADAYGAFTNTLVALNHASGRGGGLTLTGSGSNELANVALIGNDAGNGGAAHLIGDGYSATFRNAAIVGNEGGPTGGILVDSTASAVVAYADFWDNTGADVTGTDPVGVDGNLAADPQFVDQPDRGPGLWDLHLAPGSALIDAGDPAILDPDGSTSDIGRFGGPGSE